MTRYTPLLALALAACEPAGTEETDEPWLAPDVILADADGVEHALSDHLDAAVLLMLGAFW